MILNYITTNEGVLPNKLLTIFNISIRTLYYDISSINKIIDNEGSTNNIYGFATKNQTVIDEFGRNIHYQYEQKEPKQKL